MENTHESKIDSRLQELEDIIANADSERQELLIAKKVMSRLNGTAKSADIAVINPKGLPRPKGTPTTFEMVQSVLETAEAMGRDGLGISEVIAEIRKNWWPGLTNAQLAPLVYQFASNGRIHKTKAGKFKRLQNKEAPES